MKNYISKIEIFLINHRINSLTEYFCNKAKFTFNMRQLVILCVNKYSTSPLNFAYFNLTYFMCYWILKPCIPAEAIL